VPSKSKCREMVASGRCTRCGATSERNRTKCLRCLVAERIRGRGPRARSADVKRLFPSGWSALTCHAPARMLAAGIITI
jgi:hypothetical protein